MHIFLFLALIYSFLVNASQRESEDVKILVLVIASDNLPCYIEEQKIWSSYMNSFPENVESYLIKADPRLKKPVLIKGDVVWSKTDESLRPGILKKTILSLEAFSDRLEHEFDYVLRANLSSFFILPRLIEFAKNLPRTKCYSGQVFASETVWHDLSWVGGHGILMSSDLALELVKQKKFLFKFPSDHNDDIVIALFFKDFLNVVAQEHPCAWISSASDFKSKKDLISKQDFFFRLKNLGSDSMRSTEEVYVQKEMRNMFYPQPIGEAHD